MSAETMNVRGTAVEVTVEPSRDRRSARFVAAMFGRNFYGDTWSALYDSLMRASKKASARVSVPATMLRGGEYAALTITGIHGGTGAPLVEWSNGTQESLPSYGRRVLLVGMTAEQRAEGDRLHTAAIEAHNAFDDWQKSNLLDWKAAVDAAIEAQALADYETEPVS